MFEYAISDGEGTLIDYGVATPEQFTEIQNDDHLFDLRQTIISRSSGEDCETGQ